MQIAHARSQPLSLVTLTNVRAMSPVTPTDFAKSSGLSDDALDANPNVTTQKNTYGTRNRNARNAIAADRTPPPAAVSRSNARNAVSIGPEVGRASSRRW